MRRRVPGVLFVLICSLYLLMPVAPPAQAGAPPCYRCDASGGNGGVDVGVATGKSDTVPGRGDGSEGRAPGRTSWKVIEEYATPACSGNGFRGSDEICTAALTCSSDDLLRYWIWHKVTYWEAGPPERITRVDGWAQEPGSFCLGADDPGITPIGVVIAQVQTGFQNLPLPRFTPQIKPAPSTLVNLATKLSAGSSEPVTLTTQPLAGIVVEVTATPTEWRWTFGDGDSRVTQGPRTTHDYLAAGGFAASVRVTWTGTFRIQGTTQSFPIRTPAYVQGPPAVVDVRQARSELVRD